MQKYLAVFIFLSYLCSACQDELEEVIPSSEELVLTNEEDLIEDYAEVEENNGPIDTTIFEADIKAQLQFLNEYDYFENEEFDVDRFSGKVADRLTAYLKQNELSKEQADSLGLKISLDHPEDNAMKIFQFSFHCGGTRGLISHSILQWVSLSGELCSYNLSKHVLCYFYEAFLLESETKQLYLFLGNETASGACMQSIAYCFQIDDDSLISDLPVFVNRPFIMLCNISLEFKESTNELIGFDEFETGDNLSARVKEQGVYSMSDSANRALVDLLDGLYSENGNFILGFNGHQFEKRY
ncbi:MAG: hypothetical protein AB8B74_01565 [Crocinitomicaceae bacterium]